MPAQPFETRTRQWPREAEETKATNKFHNIRVDAESITYQGQSYPLAGAKATVEVGAERKRVTATRLIAVGVFALAAKKNESKVYVTFDLADGQMLVAEASHKEEKAARDFAAFINSASARLSKQQIPAPDLPAAPARAAAAPPSPSVPAGWYPDPQNATLQRYWDGSVWTEHTAPAGPLQ